MNDICLYCRVQHPRAALNAEHIVPKKISGRDYVISPVCRFRNSYFSRAFETSVTGSPLFSFLRRAFGPGASHKPMFVGTALTAAGREYRRFYRGGNEFSLAAKIEEASTRFIEIVLSDDRVFHRFEIELPCEIPKSISGSNISPERLERKQAEATSLVHAHLAEFRRNPAVNPALRAKLLEIGVEPSLLPDIVVSAVQQSNTTGGNVISDATPMEVEVPTGGLLCLLAKIGWLYACELFGPQSVHRSIGAEVLALISHVHADVDGVTAREAIAANVLSLWEKPSPDGTKTSRYFWSSDSWSASAAQIEASTVSEDLKSVLRAALDRRVAALYRLANFVKFEIMEAESAAELRSTSPNHILRVLSPKPIYIESSQSIERYFMNPKHPS